MADHKGGRGQPIDFGNLSEAEAKAIAQALESVGDVIEIGDQHGVLRYVNRRFQEVTGYSLDEALGSTPRELLRSTAHDSALFGAIWDTTQRGLAWKGEFEGRRKDGSTYRQLVTVAPVLHEGEIPLLLAIKRPIDDISEEAARVLAAAESTRDAERSALRERLRVAKEALVASASMAVVGQLAAAVGHEINNPSQVLRSCLEHLVESGKSLSPADVAETLDDALLALDRIETVTAELVPFASPLSAEAGAIDVNDCVRFGLRLAKNELRYRAQIVESLGESLLVDGIEARLSQLMAGVLLAIAHHLEEDNESNTIRVSTEGDEQEVRVRLHCDATVSQNFFKEFALQLANWEGTQVPANSRWITVILCQQIAVAHGGSLAVEKTEGGVPEIVIRLPRSARQAPVARKKVLIVDDEELILRSLRRMLRADYDVEICSSGRKALEMIQANEYDAILCDIMMPGLGGVAVYEALEKIRPEARERMIFISAGTFTEKTQKFAKTTKQPVMEKPVTQKALRQVIEALLYG